MPCRNHPGRTQPKGMIEPASTHQSCGVKVGEMGEKAVVWRFLLWNIFYVRSSRLADTAGSAGQKPRNSNRVPLSARMPPHPPYQGEKQLHTLKINFLKNNNNNA